MIYVGHWLGVHCVFFLHCCLWSINKDLFIISSKILSLKPKQHLIKDPLLSGTHGHNFLPCLHIINYAMSIILLFSLGWKLRSYGPASGVQSGQEHTKQEADGGGASGSGVPMNTTECTCCQTILTRGSSAPSSVKNQSC